MNNRHLRLTFAQRAELTAGFLLSTLLAISLAALALTNCAPPSDTQTVPVQRPSLESAKLAYADAILAYDTAISAIEIYSNTVHPLAAAQKARVDRAQANVRLYQPKVRTLLKLWAAAGSEPAAFDDAWLNLQLAFADVQAVKTEAGVQ